MFHEVDNSDEDDGQGVILDPASFMSASPALNQRAFAGDELFFTGYDLANGRTSANAPFDDVGYGDGYGYSDEDGQYDYEPGTVAYPIPEQTMEEALVQSALEKIRKARARGRNNVNLSQDEVDALERRRQYPALEAPAPKTPSKGRGSRSGSVVSISSDKSRKKNNRLIAAASPSSSRSRGTPKSSRKPSNEQNNAAYTSGSAAAAAAAAAAPPPGFRVAGPDGQPIYAPFGYYPPSDTARHSPTTSRTTSRSTSASSKRQPTPPYDAPHPPGYQSRYYGPPTPDLRPRSSTSTRSDEPPRIPRNRSASSAQQYYADVFGPGPNPAPPGIGSAGGRRNFSGPPDVSYSTLRRVPPASSSPLRASVPVSASDPNLRVGRGSKSALGKESSSSTDEEGEGVQVEVEVVPETRTTGGGGEGYRIDRVPVGGERKRKGRR